MVLPLFSGCQVSLKSKAVLSIFDVGVSVIAKRPTIRIHTMSLTGRIFPPPLPVYLTCFESFTLMSVAQELPC